MKVVRHGKPAKAYLETLRKKPKRADYERLVNACLEAIITGQADVIVAFAYVLKLPKDFPRGILEEKIDDKNIHRIKARKLLQWLHDKGHTEISLDLLWRQQFLFSMEELKREKFLNPGLLENYDSLGEEIEETIKQLESE